MAVAMPSHFIGRRQVEGDCRLLEQVSEGETVQLLDCSPFGFSLCILVIAVVLLVGVAFEMVLTRLLVGVELLGQWDVSDALLETPTTTGPGSAPQQHILTPRRLEFSMINNVAHYDFNGHTIVPLSCIIQGSTQNNNKTIFVAENSGTFKFHDT
uniref:Uncharacterized protein n=1 Tax=Oryza rufipogon TaxID=4529 RepID=A0A0E0QNN4_ORYRU